MAWYSTLSLGFSTQADNSHTTLVQREHQGALRVQKSLYPEAGTQQGICHVIILYPPAGIALGDALTIEIGLNHAAQAVITTPGANKWYGSLPNYTAHSTHQDNKSAPVLAHHAIQNVNVYLQDDSRIEWLPQENCFYDGSHAHTTNQFFLSPNASLIAWEINLLGREYHGERYTTGSLDLTNLFWRLTAGKPTLLLADTLSQSAKDDWFGSPVGLNNHHVFATLWVVPSLQAQHKIVDWVKHLKVFIESNQLPLSCTQTGAVLIIRYLGTEVRHCFDSFCAVRGEIRTLMWQQDNHLPRIWAT